MKMQGIILLKHFVATEVGDTFPQHFNIGTIFIVDNIRVQQNTIKTIIRTKKLKSVLSCSIYKICEKEVFAGSLPYGNFRIVKSRFLSFLCANHGMNVASSLHLLICQFLNADLLAGNKGLKNDRFRLICKEATNIKANKIYYKELKFRPVSSGKSD